MSRHVERQATRMNEMMERLDVDPLKLARLRQGDAYLEARTRCLKCADVGECLHWLEHPSATTEGPDFCPNSTLFGTCKRD
jgi:hypothetical protein